MYWAKNYVSILLLCFVCVSLVRAQHSSDPVYIEAYQKYRQHTADTNTVNALINLSVKYQTNLDSAISIMNMAIAITDRFPQHINPKVRSNYTLAAHWEAKGDFKKALSILNKQLENAKKLGKPNILSRYYRKIGDYQRDLLSFSNALNSYQLSLKYCELQNDSIAKANIYLSFAILYDLQNQNEKALAHYLKAIEIYKAFNDTEGISKAYSSVAVIFFKVKDFDSAAKYAQLGVEADAEFAYLSYQTLIDIYREKKDSKNALATAKKALVDAKLTGEENSIASFYTRLFTISYDENFYEQALKYLDSAQLYTHNEVMQFSLDWYRANVYMEKNDLAKAAIYWEKASANFNPDDEPFIRKNFHEGISEFYKRTNNLQAANEHLQKALALKDSIYDLEHVKLTQQLEYEYATEEQKAIIKAQQKVLQRRTWLTGGLALVAILLMGALFLFVKQSRAQHKAATQLYTSNTELQTTNQDLQQQLETLQQQPADEAAPLNPTLELGAEKQLVKINDIIYLEAMQNRIQIVLTTQTLHSWESLRHHSDLLAFTHNFAQPHRSYIVNYQHIKQRKATFVVMSNDTVIPIGRRYKEEFSAWLDSKFQV